MATQVFYQVWDYDDGFMGGSSEILYENIEDAMKEVNRLLGRSDARGHTWDAEKLHSVGHKDEHMPYVVVMKHEIPYEVVRVMYALWNKCAASEYHRNLIQWDKRFKSGSLNNSKNETIGA